MNIIQREDIKLFAETFELANDFLNSSFLITGATGLIGSTLVHCLLALNKNITITCPIRSLEKAKVKYEDKVSQINFVECDLTTYLSSLSKEDKFDYIVHCASPTVGKYMVEHPVETYELAIDTTRALLKHSHCTNAKGLVYISSLEYYGQILTDCLITEDVQGYVDNTDSRSSYPLGKRAAEYLCTAYAKQYGVNVKVARLTQTFGAGIDIDDNRVFAQFARSVIASNNIILHTQGESSKPYCYTTDSVSAILYILLKGKKGEAYNVANPNTYISIREMAEFLRDNFNPVVKVIIEKHPGMGYAPITKLNLSSDKLMLLGWKSKYDLKEMYNNLINSIKDETNN